MKNYSLKAMLGCLAALLALMMPATALADSTASFPVNITQTDNGTVTADKATVSLGETFTLTVTPVAGYELDTIYASIVYVIQGGNDPARAPRKVEASINLAVLMPTKIDDTHYSFTLPTEISAAFNPTSGNSVSVRVEAVYKELPATGFPVSINQTANGTVTSDKARANLGETVTLTVTPNEGFELDTISASMAYEVQSTGESGRAPRKAGLFVGVVSLTLTKIDDTHYSFTLPTEISGTLTPENIENVVVRVEPLFKELPATGFPINIFETANGTVTADKARANLGETVTLTVTPSTGYQLDTLEAYIGYEITGTDDPARTPRKAPIYLNVMDLSLTKVDDTHYSFTLPEQVNSELTPKDLSSIQVRVSAKFKANRIPGDVNEDGNLDIADLNILTNIVLGMTAAEEYPNADINGDGAVNTSDLNLLTTILLEKQ